mgnify:FL=1
MKLFSKGPEKSIQEYISEAKKREGSIFLDVRTPEEYSEGHIEGSINLPLHELKKIGSVIPDQEAPVYVYCLSGARSRRSAALMGHMGYLDVTDMGGLLGQKVKLVR